MPSEAMTHLPKPAAMPSRIWHPHDLGYWLPDYDLGPLRRLLGGFAEQRLVVIPGEQWHVVDPFVSNVWIHARQTVTPTAEDPVAVHSFHCKFSREQTKSKGRGDRAKPAHADVVCNARRRVLVTYAVVDDVLTPEIVEVTVDLQATQQHTHTLERCDALRHNNGLRAAGKRCLEGGWDLNKTSCNKHWKEDRQSQKLAMMCGLHEDKGITSHTWANWEAKARKERANAPEAARLTAARVAMRSRPWEEQVDDARAWLELEGITCDIVKSRDGGASSHALVFLPAETKFREAGHTLATYGRTFLLDATHCTNRKGWYLFTILCRDDHGRWRPAAHFLSSSMQAHIVAAALKKLLTAVPLWVPLHVITDDSGAEQKAVRDVNTRQKLAMRCWLCQKHWKSSVHKLLKGKECQKARRLADSALFSAKSREECVKLSKRAVDAVPNEARFDDVREKLHAKLLIGDNSRWAKWARMNIPMLLQVPTTSPLEGYHSALKGEGFKGEMKSFSHREACQRIVAVDASWHQKADGVATSAGNLLHLLQHHDDFRLLPQSLQALTLAELSQAQKDEEEAAEQSFFAPDVQKGLCGCLFFCKFRLPCACLWRTHIVACKRADDDDEEPDDDDPGERIPPETLQRLIHDVVNRGSWLGYSEEWADPLEGQLSDEGDAWALQQSRNTNPLSSAEFATARDAFFSAAESLQNRFYYAAERLSKLPGGRQKILELANGLGNMTVTQASFLSLSQGSPEKPSAATSATASAAGCPQYVSRVDALGTALTPSGAASREAGSALRTPTTSEFATPGAAPSAPSASLAMASSLRKRLFGELSVTEGVDETDGTYSSIHLTHLLPQPSQLHGLQSLLSDTPSPVLQRSPFEGSPSRPYKRTVNQLNWPVQRQQQRAQTVEEEFVPDESTLAAMAELAGNTSR